MFLGIIFFIVIPFFIMYFAISFSKWLGEAIFGKDEDKFTFVDKSIHHHHHHHEHKNISIIDDVTKKKIFELKDKN